MKSKKIKNVISIDINAEAVKFAVGSVSNNNLSINKAGYSTLPDSVFQDGHVVNQTILEDTIKTLLKTNKVKMDRCFCCVESSQIISRNVLIPNNKNADLLEMTKFEMAQYLPVELINYIVQAKILREVEVDDKPFLEVEATAIPKQLVDKLHTTLHNVGLKPLVLDTYSNAIAKLLEGQVRINNQKVGKKLLAFIDFGVDSIDLFIIKDGKLGLHRLIPSGSKELDANIARSLDMSMEEVVMKRMAIHNLFQEPTETVSDENRLKNLVRISLESWFDEIQNIFRYYASRSEIYEPVETIYIYGAITNINGMPEFLQANTGILTKKINILDMMEWSGYEKGLEISDYIYALGTMYRK